MSDPIIPSRMHLFWAGGPPGSQELACLRLARHFHPDWSITVHSEDVSVERQALLHLANVTPLDWLDCDMRRFYDQASSSAMRSDVVRYAALKRWGGVWLDFDVVCLRPLDKLRGYAGFAGSESFGLIGSSVIGAMPESPVIRRALDLILEWFDPTDGLSIGPRLLTRAVLDHGADWHILEPEAFYAWRWSQAGRSPRKEELLEAFAIHLCHSLGPANASLWDTVSEIIAQPWRREYVT